MQSRKLRQAAHTAAAQSQSALSTLEEATGEAHVCVHTCAHVWGTAGAPLCLTSLLVPHCSLLEHPRGENLSTRAVCRSEAKPGKKLTRPSSQPMAGCGDGRLPSQWFRAEHKERPYLKNNQH
jgi:hypothetical protein